jgi:hypothetical protein
MQYRKSFAKTVRVSVGLSLCFLLGTATLWAQHSPPVRNLYLSPIEVLADADDSLKVNFTLHKDGRTNEQLERQCYLLLYLKTNEAKILQIANAAEFAVRGKQDSDTAIFAEMLKKQSLVITLASKVAKHVPAKPQPEPPKAIPIDHFPFEFSLDHASLFEALNRVEGFDAQGAVVNGDSRWFKETFKIAAFFPLNQSEFADKVDPKYKGVLDFGRAYMSGNAVLFFRSLPYEFNIQRVRDRFLIDIH